MDSHGRRFLGEDFLLDNRTSATLYHEVARRQPIIDYHCHLSPDDIASDRRFANLTQIWLAGDHYKWRAMRTNGVSERFCTGDASDEEKFQAWARTVPATLRNPLYIWTHMELAFPFGIHELLGPDTAQSIWERANAKLAGDDFSTRGLLRQYDVRVVCTTDDPVDDLAAHARHAADPLATTRMFPTFRPDRALALGDLAAWNAWIDRLEAAADVAIAGFATLVEALRRRHDFFHARGCRASDLGIERVWAEPFALAEVERTCASARAGRAVSPAEADQVRSALLHELAVMNHERDWVQQLHLGAQRNNCTRARLTLGADSGHDAIGDLPQAASLARFLDALDADNQLARTIVYNLNPADNEVFASMIGCFQDGSIPGKIQLGSAWWFLDQKSGIEQQLDALSNLGLLARFIGMLTDSRSFLSYSRHEYFRRILCNVIGRDVEAGLLPADLGLLGRLVADVCFGNVRAYFGFDV